MANFLGTPNEFKGYFQRAGGFSYVVLSNNYRMKVSFQAEEGQEMLISLRPEVIRHKPTTQDDNGFLEDISFLGSKVRYIYMFDGQMIIVEDFNKPGSIDRGRSDKISLYIHPDDIIQLS